MSDPKDFSNKSVNLVFYCIVFLVALHALASIGSWSYIRPDILDAVSLNLVEVMQKKELWRLITGNLFHMTWEHLFSNMLGFYIFGQFVIRQTGPKVFLLWLLAAMWASDLFSLGFGIPASIGFSGVVYGLEAAFLMLQVKTLVVFQQKTIWQGIYTLAGYVLLLTALNIYTSQQVNLFAHLGGAIAGALLAALYPVSLPNIARARPVVIQALIVNVIFILALAWLVH